MSQVIQRMLALKEKHESNSLTPGPAFGQVMQDEVVEGAVEALRRWAQTTWG